MRPHLRYLRYVLRHKYYVARAGFAIMRHRTDRKLVFAWRLLVHDLSKFSRAEWTPYVDAFYGEKPGGDRAKKAAFQWAWLHHLHANAHHWQHWLLREDDGKTLTLIPDALLVDEMVADWLAAGPKANHAHTLAHAIAETIVWYAQRSHLIVLRQEARTRVELTLLELAREYGVEDVAHEIASAQRARASIEIPGR